MEIKEINYYGSDGWENNTTYNHTKSSELHVPRKGDNIRNKFGNLYIVSSVTWNLSNNSINVDCTLV